MIIRILRKIFRNKTLITTFTKSFDDHYGPNRFLNTLINISGGKIRKNRILSKCILFISPNKFSRFIPLFKLLGYKIIYRIDGIRLFNNELMSKSLKIKNANPRKIKINNRIVNILKKSDAVIYQSLFCKNIIEYFFPEIKPLRSFIIHNTSTFGPSSKTLNNQKFLKIIYYPKKKYPIIYKEFLEIVSKTIKKIDSNKFKFTNKLQIRFLVIGNLTDKQYEIKKEFLSKNKNIKKQIDFLETQKREDLLKILSSADILLSLKPYDWCPNAVLEAKNFNLKIIYLTPSGTSELVDNNDIGIESEGLNYIGNKSSIKIANSIVKELKKKNSKNHINVKSEKYLDPNLCLKKYLKIAKKI